MKGEALHTEQIILWDTEYGEVHCNLKDVMKKKKITIYQLVRISGIKYDVIERYYSDEVIRFDSNVLAKLCYSLDCDISDVLKYQRSSW